jgi:branched-chain amino acid transport system permease protein
MAESLPMFGLSYWPALVVAVLSTSLAGLLLYDLLLRHIGQKEFERSILTTLGISMILLYGMQYLFTATPIMVDTAYGFDGVEIGSIRITWTRIIAAGLSIVAFSGLYALLQFTQLGRAMRAIAQNREAAMIVGIQSRHVARCAVVLAAALCGLAGAALAPIQLLHPAMGQAIIFKAFALVVIGGLGNMLGAVVVAIALGLIESFVGGFFGIVWQESAIFSIMIVAVLLRPNGIFQRPGMRVG